MPTVLYVDDERAISRAVETWLRRRGTDAYTASDIRGAKACFARHAFDGAFIDLWLGDESGFELYDWIAEQHPAVAERVVFVTGAIIPSPAMQRQLEFLDKPVLLKPFSLTELDDYVGRWSTPGNA